MGEIGDPYGLADGTMFSRDIAIVGRYFPAGDLLKRRSELGMLSMKRGSLQRFLVCRRDRGIVGV